MNRAFEALVLLTLRVSSLQAAELSPQDFAFGSPIETATQAAAYRFAVPLAVYQNTSREDLGDLRVFNAQHESVPYSLLQRAPPSNRATDTQLPLFPLPNGSRVVIDGVHVTIDSRGSAVNLQTQTSSAANVSASQYILDGRTLSAPVVGLRLDWSRTDTAYSGHIRVEASDDLSSWRTITASAPVVNLQAGDQAIIQNRVPLPATTAKFWRITWIGASPAFALNSIFAESADTPRAARAILDVAGIRDTAAPEYYLFDLGAHPPVDRVTLLLSDMNMLVNAELSSRDNPHDPWRPIMQMGVYRLAADDGELTNRPSEINVDRDRYWRVRLAAKGGLSQTPLRLQVEWVPDEVTYLARGRGPFMLAYGNSSATTDQSDFNQIPVSIEIAGATVGAPILLGGLSRLSVQAPPFPRSRFALWGILILAVLGLAWMARRLIIESSAVNR